MAKEAGVEANDAMRQLEEGENLGAMESQTYLFPIPAIMLGT